MRERDWSGTYPFAEGTTRPNLAGALLRGIDLSRNALNAANLSGVDLRGARLSGALLRGAILSDAYLYQADLSGAYLRFATLSGAFLREADLRGADLRSVRMDVGTVLFGATLDAGTRLADVLWNGVPLTRIDWEPVRELGDQRVALTARDDEGRKKEAATRLQEYQGAVLAYRQLATVLRSEGLSEPADRFAYQAQRLQRTVWWRQAFLRQKGHLVRLRRRARHLAAYGGSLLLDGIAGYGYRPLRSVIAYVAIIALFAGAFLLNGQFAAPHLRWDEALVLSISSFHGRGFFTTGISLGDTLARLAAGEAIIGLLIEITFIATFTQRFFAR
jgi:hypothetical protein